MTHFFNWKRHILSLFISILLWHGSQLFTSTTISHLTAPVFVQNIPENKIITDIDNDGKLPLSVPIIMKVNKNLAKELKQETCTIIIDLKDQNAPYVLIKVSNDKIFFGERSLESLGQAKLLYTPEITLSILERKRTVLKVNLEIPHEFKHKIAGILPDQINHIIDGPTNIVDKQLESGLNLKINKNLLKTAESNFLEEGIPEVGVVVNIPPNQKLELDPSISQSPRLITDGSDDSIKIFFLPTKGIYKLFKMKLKTNSVFKNKRLHNKVISPNGDLITPIKIFGVSDIFLDSSDGFLFLEAVHSSLGIKFVTSISNIESWEKRFIGKVLHLHKNMGTDEIHRVEHISKVLFYNYLINMLVDKTDLDNLKKSIISHYISENES